jgi:hypothetical protein
MHMKTTLEHTVATSVQTINNNVYHELVDSGLPASYAWKTAYEAEDSFESIFSNVENEPRLEEELVPELDLVNLF